MGTADIIPGVSGGTMALITGIYEPLLNAIRSVDARVIGHLLRFQFRKAFFRIDLSFLLWLGFGIAGAIIFFTRIVPLQRYMMSHPELVYGLFFGLILGSIVILLMEVEKKDRSFLHAFGVLGGAAVGIWIVTLVPSDTPETWWFLFFSGMMALSAMILPGISGSFILLILRKYDFILAQIGAIGGFYTLEAILALIPFAIGALAGLALFSRFLSWLLDRFHAGTMMVLVGFLIGSLYVIWPWQDREYIESVRSVEVYMMTDPQVQELLQTEPDPYALRFRRVGKILTPDAAFDEFKQVEVEEVSRKMISTTPYWPLDRINSDVEFPDENGDAISGNSTLSEDPTLTSEQTLSEDPNLKEGIGGILAGILLTYLIFQLRRRTS